MGGRKNLKSAKKKGHGATLTAVNATPKTLAFPDPGAKRLPARRPEAARQAKTSARRNRPTPDARPGKVTRFRVVGARRPGARSRPLAGHAEPCRETAPKVTLFRVGRHARHHGEVAIISC